MVDFYGARPPLQLDMNTLRKYCGSHWFEAGVMRFFKTRILSGTVPGAHGAVRFVTSERGPVGPRKYTVREGRWVKRKDGRWVTTVQTVGEFCAYATARAARRAMATMG